MTKPIAWHVTDKKGQVWACVESEDEALQIARDFSNTDNNHMVYLSFPVYRQITLTDKEIEAMAYFAHFFPVCAAEIDAASDILRNLLERTKDK